MPKIRLEPISELIQEQNWLADKRTGRKRRENRIIEIEWKAEKQIYDWNGFSIVKCDMGGFGNVFASSVWETWEVWICHQNQSTF